VTPSQVETAARNRYNASSDSFYSQSEIFDLIYQGEMILATETNCIEASDSTTTTVSGTQSYAFPTNFISVKRVEWNGRRLKRVDMREDDLLTAMAADTTTTGDPTYYFEWNGYVYLREIPGSAETLKFFGYKQPTALSTSPVSSSLSVPARYHTSLINYVTAHIAAKDKDFEGLQSFMKLWEQDLQRARVYEKRRQRMDQFSYVRTEEQMSHTEFGI
jgi:hypothetical protein